MNLKTIYIVILASIFSGQAQAQISQGGTPPSFNSSLKNTFETVYLEAVSETWKTEHAALASKNGTVDPSAKAFQTNLTLENAGTWETKKNGDRIWRLKISADQAQGMNAYFKNFYLPESAKLFLYNANKTQVIGAFTAFNNHESQLFATEIIKGNTLILEYYEPKEVATQGHFTIEKIASFFKNIVHSELKYFGNSDESCEVNVNCSEAANFADEKKGVARIITPLSATSVGFCSGSLMNNTANDCKPYMLTAYHCGDNASAADFQQWIFYFNYEFANCSATASNTAEPSSNTMTGAAVKARSNDLNSSSVSSDFLLLELSNNVPTNYNVYYNGWDASASIPTSGVSIHHPSGDVKKVSTFNSPPSTRGVAWNANGTYSVNFNTTHWSLNWVATANGHGVTEGGSSGSSLFNSQGLVVGTLTGGSSSCTNKNADDQYGKMSYHWTSNASTSDRQLKPWLDPTNSGATTLTGTYAPCTSTATLDAELTNFQSPSVKNCDFNIKPQVFLQNSGNVNLLSATISYQLNNGATQTSNWTGNLGPNSKELISLTTSTTSTSSNAITATVSNPNGLIDENNTNNSISLNFEAGVSNDLPFLENADLNPPTNKILFSNPDDDVTWAYPGFGSYGTSSNCFFIDNWDYDAANQLDWLITESYDFSNLVDEELYFDLAYTYYQQTNGNNVSYDSLGIAVSTDCGENFYWLWKKGGKELATVAGGLGDEFAPQDHQWESKTIDLSELNGEDNVSFAFIAINGYGNNLYIDNIGIGKVLLNIEKDDENWGSDFSIFPNPASDILNLDISNEGLNYKIVNNIGQEMSKGKLIASENTLDISSLNKGIYFLEVYSEKGNKLMKFIKK